MAPLNEITSTEKLLDFIRNKSGSAGAEGGSAEEGLPAPVLPSPRKKIARLIPFRKVSPFKAATVGVCIGHDYLWLAKTTKGANGAPVLVDKRQVAIPRTLNRTSPEFINILRTELASFCQRQKKQQLWAIMSAAGVEVRHIRIPKVPRKQIENAVYWTVKKETPFDERETIFDFEVLGEVVEQGIAKYAVMYYTAPKRIIEETKKIFTNAGWSLTGVSIPPFALQNIFRTEWNTEYGGTFASLFIGNDFSRIDIFAQGNLVMTRGIKAGINSMLESLIEGLQGKTPAAGSGEGDLHIDIEQAKKVLFSLSPDSPPLEKQDPGYGLTEEEIWQMILPAFERLVRQADRTFEHFSVNLGNEKVDKIYVSAAMNVYPRIARYVGEQLNMESDVFDPLEQQVCSPYEETDFPCVSERVAFAPTLGIALSDNTHTPNLDFTYKDKESVSALQRINMSLVVVFLVCLTLCTGVFVYQLQAMEQKRKTIAQLEKQLSPSKAPISRDLIMQTLSAVQQDMASAKIYSRRYQGLAVLSELSNLTPPDIRLINVKATIGDILDKSGEAPATKAEAPARGREVSGKEVGLEGFVVGERKILNNSLADYVIKLDNSPLFQQIKVQKINEETFRKTALLRFVITMRLEGL